jgi:hypothetical protein
MTINERLERLTEMSAPLRLDLNFASAYDPQVHDSLCEAVNGFVEIEFNNPDRLDIHNIRFVQQRGIASDFHGSVWVKFLRNCRGNR